MIDYRERAKFWRKAAEGNLDMLVKAYREIRQLEELIRERQDFTERKHIENMLRDVKAL